MLLFLYLPLLERSFLGGGLLGSHFGPHALAYRRIGPRIRAVAKLFGGDPTSRGCDEPRFGCILCLSRGIWLGFKRVGVLRLTQPTSSSFRSVGRGPPLRQHRFGRCAEGDRRRVEVLHVRTCRCLSVCLRGVYVLLLTWYSISGRVGADRDQDEGAQCALAAAASRGSRTPHGHLSQQP